ncbi:MAG: hypothetical protein Q8862_00920 [Bacteroidota bacterium]|nr:hypothetical protein [Bacteroidota bacterium]
MGCRDSVIKKVRDNWILASERIGFKIVSPYTITYNGKEKQVFAFLPKYGSTQGMIIDLIFPPDYKEDNDVTDLGKQNGFYWSFINVESYSKEYDERLFIETLLDWGEYKNE